MKKKFMNNNNITTFSLVAFITFIVVMTSCSIDILDIFGNGSEESAHTHSESETILVVGITSGTNISTLVETLDARLLETMQIGEHRYMRIAGGNFSMEEINNIDTVRFVEPELMRNTFAIPNDAEYHIQYAPQRTNMESVWGIDESGNFTGITGAGTIVAVIDTGVNTLHEDFDGTSAFSTGYDYAIDKSYTTATHNDNHGHGTHVAGIIAARVNNGKGIAGVAHNVTIMPIKATTTESNGSFSQTNLSNAVRYATENGADVINMSLGGLEFSFLEQDAINYAISNGVTVVAAAGNDTMAIKVFPASYPGVIAVASSNGRDEISFFSSRNNYISVAAPGENILSLDDRAAENGTYSRYIPYSGTSMATPFVAGVVALLKEKFPNATPAQIKKLLENTAKDIEASGFDRDSGHGRVDPVAALAVDTLPSIVTANVEFSFSLNSEALENTTKRISVYDASNDIVAYLIADYTTGKATANFPNGSYTVISYHEDVQYSGSFTIAGEDITHTIDFIIP